MATRKKKMVSSCENWDGTPFHYFASSIATWKVDTDLQKLIKYMQSEGFTFNIFKVDLDIKAPYGISGYAPDLPKETSRFIAHFKIEE